MIKPLRYADILNLSDALKESKAFDLNFDTVLGVIGKNAMLSEDDKCILGLALVFYSKRIDVPKDNRTAHEFCMHDAYASACYLEELAHSIIGDHIDVLRPYSSSAMFVNTIADAAFVVMNSMSRGFNVGYIKRFGGDAHLQWLAAKFVTIVCWTYTVMLFNRSDGFAEYEKRHLDKITNTGCAYNKRDARLMYARFATWLRKKFRTAQRVICPNVFSIIDARKVVATLRISSEEQARTADKVEGTKNRVRKTHTKPVDFPKKETLDRWARSCDSDDDVENPTRDLCHWIRIKRGDEMFELTYDFDHDRFAIHGNLTPRNLDMLKRKGFVAKNFELSDDGKFLVPAKTFKIHIN